VELLFKDLDEDGSWHLTYFTFILDAIDKKFNKYKTSPNMTKFKSFNDETK